MDKKGQDILDDLLGKNQDVEAETDLMKFRNDAVAAFDAFVEKATTEAIEAARLAIKPFPVPNKMLENITNGVRPVMKKFLTEAYNLGELTK